MSTKKRKPVDLGEFAPALASAAEPETVDIVKFARDILNSEAYRTSLRQRAASGKLSPAESRMLTDLGRTAEPVRPKGPSWISFATPLETKIIANVARRAMKLPESTLNIGQRQVRQSDFLAGV